MYLLLQFLSDWPQIFTEYCQHYYLKNYISFFGYLLWFLRYLRSNWKVSSKLPFLVIFKKSKFQSLSVRKLKKISKNPYVFLLNTISKVFCQILSQKRSKRWEEIAFALGHFSKHFGTLRKPFGIFRKFFWKFFLVLLSAFRIHMVMGV